MTLLEDRLATPAELPRPRRAVPDDSRPATPDDEHTRLAAASNRLLGTALTTEMTAQEALSFHLGALMNMAREAKGKISARDLVEALTGTVERTADRLCCPPAPPDLAPDGQVGRLAQTLADYPRPFAAAVDAAGDFRESRTDADWDALCVAAGVLCGEFDVRVGQ